MYKVRVPILVEASYETSVSKSEAQDTEEAMEIAISRADNKDTAYQYGRFLNCDSIMITPHIRDVIVEGDTSKITVYDSSDNLIN